MKQIKPIKILNKEAVYLDTYIIMDNLKDKCTLYYNLLDDTAMNSVYSGNIIIQDADYEKWTDNEYAWNYVANELGLIFI